MNTFKCKRCNKEFKTKHGYEKHIIKQIPCEEDKKKEYLIKGRTCSKCGKIFQRPNLLQKHKEKCDKKDNQNDSQENEKKSELSKIYQNAANNHQIAANNHQNAANNHQNAANNHQNVEKKINDKECIYCKKVFTRTSSLNVHLENRCKIKKIRDQEKEDLMTKLIKEKEEQKKVIEEQSKQLEKVLKNIEEMKSNQDKLICEIEKLKKKTVKRANNVQYAEKIQNNTLNNTVNNIKIIAYGKEDLSHILENDYKMILNKGFKSVPALVESIHFNKNKPENHNIYISNMRDNYVLIYNGNDWQLRERENILQELVDNKTDILNEKFDELVDNLDEATVRKFRRFLDQKDDDVIVNSIKKDLRLLLYNKRKEVTNSKGIEVKS